MAVFPVHHQLPELAQTHVHRVGDTILPSHFFVVPFSSCIRDFYNESVLHIRWPKYWSFSFRISPSNEYSGLIFFRIDWLDLLAVQGTLKSSSPTPQFKNINSLVLSFIVQISLVAQRLKRLPARRETWVQSLGQEDPLEKEMATHSSTLAWRILWTQEPGRLQSTGSQRVGHN